MKLRTRVALIAALVLLRGGARAEVVSPSAGLPPVIAQQTTPGTVQTAHMNISGNVITANNVWLKNSSGHVNKSWSLLNNNSDVLEFNRQNDDGTNPQTQCQMPDVGNGYSFSCVGEIQASTIRATTGQVYFKLSSNSLNQKTWRAEAGTATLDFETLDDAETSSTRFLRITRSGVTPTAIATTTPLIVGSERGAAFGSGASFESWGQADFLCGTGSSDCPDVRLAAVHNSGFIVRFNRVGATDADERMLWQDQNGNTQMTFDSINNRLTAPNVTVTTGVGADGGGLKHKRGTAGYATGAAAGATCTTVVTWTTAFADANYTAQCNGRLVTSGVPLNGGLTAQVAASVTFQTVAATAAAAQFTNIDCIAVHD